MHEIGVDATKATAIVQGFGNVGSVTAIELAKLGVKIIGISDHTSCFFDQRGLDVSSMIRHVENRGSLRGFQANEIAPSDLLVQPCDILVPAALERVINSEVAGRLQCRILAEGANGPTTPEADVVLDERGRDIFVIPDILCNAGGVIVSYFEWVQDLQQLFWGYDEVVTRLNQILDKSFNEVIERSKRDGISHRTSAMSIGVDRVRLAKKKRGLFP
jgi:glutamate dehydrogenase (NAD(P)+)